MTSAHRFALAFLLLPVSAVELLGQDTEKVHVVNLPAVQAITGRVEMTTPATNTALATIEQAVVAPVAANDTDSLVLAGVLEAGGFRSAVLSIAGQVKANFPGEGTVGAFLLPDTPLVKRAFEEDGEVLLAVRIEAAVEATPTAYFSASGDRLDLAFPSYRVYFFNTTEQPVSVSLFAYLAN